MTKVLRIHRELEQDSKPITAEILKRHFYGENDSPKMLLEVFKKHNKKYRELLDKDVVLGTVLRYERTVRYLEEFMKAKHHLSDIPLKNINLEFVKEFEHFIKTEKDCAQNATVKYLLTTHIARHTFACLAIVNKVSTESIAKMLGHTDIRTTKIYARILDRTVADKMQILRGKFAI